MSNKETWAPWEIQEYRERINEVFDQMEVLYGESEAEISSTLNNPEDREPDAQDEP